jgi:hypothetical protein
VHQLKRLSKEAIPRALEKAVRYRTLNEPLEAESICLDILAVEPSHPQALITLFLARTDQLDAHPAQKFEEARALLPRLGSAYEQSYYSGILFERRAKARLAHGGHGTGAMVYEWLVRAMEHFDDAAKVRPGGNDDALLRWNACARILDADPSLTPDASGREEQMLE